MRVLLYSLFTLFLFSCFNDRSIKEPFDLIPQDKMVDILSEFIIINSAQGSNKKFLESKMKNPVDYIYKKYSIDSLQFENSNAYYSANIEIYNSIYDSIKIKLESRKEEIQYQIDEKITLEDSIKKQTKNERKKSKINKFISRKTFLGNNIDTTFQKTQ
tara:strand:- start:341 stop:817 length:477 start_codon:yes stop_codon:yes gene_type:complete